MRTLPLLAIPALFSGCSIPLNFDLVGQFDFVIGEIKPNCTVGEEPPKNCTIETSGVATTGECVITAICSELMLVDTTEVQAEIDDATNNNDRITARMEALTLTADALAFTGFNGKLPPGTSVTATAYTTSNSTAFDLEAQDYEDVLAGNPTTIFDESTDAGSPFLDELNNALTDDTTVPLTGELIVTIPDVTTFGGTDPGAKGTLDWSARIEGRGGVSLRRQ